MGLLGKEKQIILQNFSQKVLSLITTKLSIIHMSSYVYVIQRCLI